MYKLFYLSQNPDFEYRFKGGSWEKRKKGSKEKWYKANENGQNILNNAYKPKSKVAFLWNYSTTAKVGLIVVALGIGYYLYSSKILSAKKYELPK